MDAKPAMGKALRIASGCSSLDEFTAVFRKFARPNSLFIATRSPRTDGFETRFAITLKDGKTVMRGSGRIAKSYTDARNPYGRPGMVIEFSKLDTMGRILLDELNASSGTKLKAAKTDNKASFEIPTIVQDPDLEALGALAASQKLGEVAVPIKPDASAGDEPKAQASTPLGLERTAGSPFILPANPFGSLSATSLQAFVECTLYEESGELEIAGSTAASGEGASAQVVVTSPLFDSAPDALDTEEARAIAAAQVAEDRRAKYVPRPPTLPGLVALGTLAPGDTQGSLASGATLEPASRVPAASSAENFMEMQRAGMVAVASRPRAILDGSERRAQPSIFAFLPLSVKRWQALVLGGVCLVAGLGFGSLFRGDKTKTTEPTVIARAQGESPLSGKLANPASASPALANTHVPEPSQPIGVAPDAAVTDLADESLVVRSQEPSAEPAALLEEPDAVETSCAVALDVVPREGQVSIGERSLPAGASLIEVACGEHKVRIEHPRYQAFRGSIEAVPGETTTLRARMERPVVYLRIVSKPAMAEVRINARRVGKTPLRRKVAGYETARIEVTSPGYKSYTKKYYPTKSATLSVSLRKLASGTSNKNTNSKNNKRQRRRK